MGESTEKYQETTSTKGKTQWKHQIIKEDKRISILWASQHVILTFQGEVEARHPLILKLGLIQGTLSGDEASTEEQPKWLTYAHKLFHDCLAGYHISRKVWTYCIRYLNFQFSISFLNVCILFQAQISNDIFFIFLQRDAKLIFFWKFNITKFPCQELRYLRNVNGKLYLP